MLHFYFVPEGPFQCFCSGCLADMVRRSIAPHGACHQKSARPAQNKNSQSMEHAAILTHAANLPVCSLVRRVDSRAQARNNDKAWRPQTACLYSRLELGRTGMNDFNRKVGDASARVNKSVEEATAFLERETAELIKYVNNEVVPAVRQNSTKALRIAAEKMTRLADYLEQEKRRAQ
jgi:hypothetical protein